MGASGFIARLIPRRGSLLVPGLLPAGGSAPNVAPVADFSFEADQLEVTFTDESSDADGAIVAWAWDFGDGGVSDEQNPVHVYTLIGTYTVRLTATDDRGGAHEAEQEIEVDLDKDNGKYFPATAQEWEALGWPAPDFLWNCQDASGNLAPAIGGVALAPNGSPTYRQAVAGYGRHWVGFADGTASQRFATSDAALDLAAGQSYAALCVAAVDAAGTRRVMGFGGDLGLAVRVTSAGLLQSVHNSVAAAGAQNHESAGAVTVHPIKVYRDATANLSGLQTDLESIAGTHDESAFAGGLKGLGSMTASAAATQKTGLLGVWLGNKAEVVRTKSLATLGWS